MKNALAMTALALITVSSAQADGLVCVGQQTATHIQVYNYTDAAAGTRNPAVMVVSSPFVKYPNKTIAKFSGLYTADQNQTLFYRGHGLFEAMVDTVNNKALRGGENIAGTKLNQLQKIVLNAHFTYGTPVQKGAKIAGTLEYVKKTGEVLSEKADCTRYLKQ